jgi:hypothetical protein
MSLMFSSSRLLKSCLLSTFLQLITPLLLTLSTDYLHGIRTINEAATEFEQKEAVPETFTDLLENEDVFLTNALANCFLPLAVTLVRVNDISLTTSFQSRRCKSQPPQRFHSYTHTLSRTVSVRAVMRQHLTGAAGIDIWLHQENRT